MREFEKYEMFKAKCPVCGCKNKVHTELKSITDRFVGYSLKCCGCGKYNEFILDHHSNGKLFSIPHKKGIQRCIQMSYCPKKDCPLYGTCNLDHNSVNFDDKNLKKSYNPCGENDNMNEDDTVTMTVLNGPKFL